MNNENNTIPKVENNVQELNLMDDFKNAVIEEPQEQTVTITPQAETQSVIKPIPTVPVMEPVKTESPIQDIKVEEKETQHETILTAQEKENNQKSWPFIIGVFSAVAAFVIILPLLFKMITGR